MAIRPCERGLLAIVAKSAKYGFKYLNCECGSFSPIPRSSGHDGQNCGVLGAAPLIAWTQEEVRSHPNPSTFKEFMAHQAYDSRSYPRTNSRYLQRQQGLGKSADLRLKVFQ